MSVGAARTVFISYSHDSAERGARVLAFAERLRQDGLDTQLDQYVNGTPEQGWPRWMLDQLDAAAFVLVVCTETYYRRFRGHETPDRGRGVDWEGALITQEIYNARSRTAKFVPVLFAASDERFIPEPLRGQTYYELTSEEGYQDLYSFLVGQAGVEPSPLGDPRPISRRAGKPLTFEPLDLPHATNPLSWLALPSLILMLLMWWSTLVPLSTRVQLDLATARLAFTPAGGEPREILARSVPFSSLVIEGCGTAVFAVERLQIADPQQLVPATQAGEVPYFPAAAWRELTLSGPMKLSCHDPAAKLTLRNPDLTATRLGLLDRIFVAPGSHVALEVSPGREPALSLEIETPQDLSLPLSPYLDLVAEFVRPEGLALPFQGDLLTYRARLPEASRSFDIKSGKQGLVLVVTPARDQVTELFADPLDIPVGSIDVFQESLEGALVSPLRDKAVLRYPEYPDVPPVTIEKDEVVGLGGLSQARLRSLEFDPEKGALRVRFEGIAGRAASRSGELVSDHRLTLFHAFRYRWRWGLIAVVAAWLVSTTWAAFEVWKKPQE